MQRYAAAGNTQGLLASQLLVLWPTWVSFVQPQASNGARTGDSMQTERPLRLEMGLVPWLPLSCSALTKVPLAVSTAQLRKRAAGHLHKEHSSGMAGLHTDTCLAPYRIKGTTLVLVPLDNNIHFKRGTCFYSKPAFVF